MVSDPVQDAHELDEPAYEPDLSADQPDDRDGHPLGPLFGLSPDRSHRTRLNAVLVLVGVAAIIGVSLYVEPDPARTHAKRRLPLRPCGFLMTTGLPCPTCGMTTSFAFMARGRVIAAFEQQPAGALLALLTVGLGVLALVVLVTGRRFEINWYRINPMHVLVVFMAVFMGSWVYRIVMDLLARRAAGFVG